MDSFENSIMRSKLVEIKRSILVNFILTLSIGIYLGFKREFSKLIGFLVIALVAVGLVFNAAVVKDVLLNLFNKIMGA
jgi:multisubunit Na+/H+ antiporter MnhC subunit